MNAKVKLTVALEAADLVSVGRAMGKDKATIADVMEFLQKAAEGALEKARAGNES